MTPSDSHGQRRERGPGAPDDDPTGIRDLLAALPDPGPMPEDLVERIGARLAVEQAHREHGSAAGFAARSDTVIDLAAERSHRRPGRTVALLGAAAAALLVATVAIGELAGVGPGAGPAFDSAAQVPTRSTAGADSGGAADEDSGGAADEAGADDDGAEAAGGEAPEGEQSREDGAGGGSQEGQGQGSDGATDDAQGGGVPGSADGSGIDTLTDELAADVVVLPPLGAVTPGDYRERVLDLVAASGEDAGALTEGQLTLAGARACWEAVVPDEPWPALHATQAELDGDRVVVLVGLLDHVTGQAVVLPWECTEGGETEPLTSTQWGY